MFETFQTKNGLQHLYDEKRPTARKVIHLLKGEPTNDAERSCFDHLKRYIRSLPCNLLHIFLQFLTGSDMIAVEHIQISFNQLDGLSRRPVARTCVPLLELPSTYQSYNELAEEFGNLLPDKESWAFNIVKSLQADMVFTVIVCTLSVGQIISDQHNCGYYSLLHVVVKKP